MIEGDPNPKRGAMNNKLAVSLACAALVVAVLGATSTALADHWKSSSHVGYAALRLCTKNVSGPVAGSRCGAIRGVKASASARARRNKFVAANGKGRVPDADKLDGRNASELAVVMRGQRDTDAGFETVLNGGQTQTNSVSLRAPRRGFFVISGNLLVNNNGVARVFLLVPRVDGDPLGFGLRTGTLLGADGSGSDVDSLAYTVTVRVPAGAHTISQTTGPEFGTTDFVYNGHNLTVLFIPVNQGAVTSVSGSGAKGSFFGN
jgi:hypothetical protein